ncbi:RNA-directed DNA polymerase, eukaryota, reverse transcriptase zinc-binding domain protein [Tanacetum coccineum]
MNGTVDCDRGNDTVDNSVIDDNGGISAESKRESLNDVIENTENDNVGMKNLESYSYEKNDDKKVNNSKESVDFVNKFEQEKRKSYADVIDENMGELDKNLMDIPTELDSNGIEIVVFDDVMIAEGSKKWERTLCAYFVGYSMAVSELKYNLRKMWSRYGFKDIVDYNNGVYFMKFNNENGLQNVVNNGPWMVKNKPLIVQKWDINMCLDKTEPETIPLWIKICSVPLEAWTIKGISALASRIGNPMVMDNVTATMCKMGVGRVGFARVLVEVSAKKPLPYEIEVVYKNEAKEVICRKIVKVVYDWKPPCCSTCCVFGHSSLQCPKNKVNIRPEANKEREDKEVNQSNGNLKNGTEKNDNEGFIPVQNKKQNAMFGKVLRPNFKPNTQQNRGGNQRGNVNGKGESKFAYQPKMKINENVVPKEPDVISKNTPAKESQKSPSQTPCKKVWNVHNDILAAMRRSANKFSVFEKYDENETNNLQSIMNKEIVEKFITRNKEPSACDMKKWNEDMIKYYKDRLAELKDKGESSGGIREENEVFPDDSGIARCMEEDGLSTSNKQKEVRSFITDENLSICAVLETHIKIMIGWNSDHVNINIVHCAKQSLFCEIHTVTGNIKMFCTFVYAANGGKERRELWKDLQIHKRIVDKHAWVIMGDMNATLASNEHSAGSSYMNTDMNEFKGCVNRIEVEDIVSSGLFYTWTKNLFKTKMGESDVMKLKKKAFKFANFVAEKEEFLNIIRKAWDNQFKGCHMFKTVKKFKSLKAELKKLAWKDGNIFDKVQELKLQLKDLQTKIDDDPYSKELRVKESKCIHEYVEAMKDEEKLLYQKAKIKWLKVGDKNNAYFHRALKSRNHRNRINAIKDTQGNLFQGEEVAEQFVNHFKIFLGVEVPVNDVGPYLPLIKKKLSSNDADFMVREVCDEEIKEALFQIDGNKAPGPDGLSSLFFIKAWDIVGKDICKAVKEFFDNGKMLKEINSTLITLIPKIDTPDKVIDFRPIACCNVIYKCISKVITNRIKGILGGIVGQYQSAFVPDRHIQDNILLSQELFKGYDRKEGPKRVAMKIDIQKAYDTVNWKLFSQVLVSMKK